MMVIPINGSIFPTLAIESQAAALIAVGSKRPRESSTVPIAADKSRLINSVSQNDFLFIFPASFLYVSCQIAQKSAIMTDNVSLSTTL